jgi:ParB family chromosome partitioning protein
MSLESKVRLVRPRMQFELVDVDKIETNRLNPRRVFPDSELDSLCKSIVRVGGIVVPLVGFRKGDRIVLLDGERRLRAAQRLGMERVPVNILPKDLSDIENLTEMFTIHREREEWNPVARAMSFAVLKELNPGVSDEELEKISGMEENDIREANLIMSFPSRIRDRALNQHIRGYGIRPAYLVEIGRTLEATEELFPGIIKKYGRQNIIETLIAKIDNRTIKNATHFRKVTEAVKVANEAQTDKIFEKLLFDKEFAPKDVVAIVPPKVTVDQITELKVKSEDFMAFLRSLPLKKSDLTTRQSARTILERLIEQIQRILRRL